MSKEYFIRHKLKTKSKWHQTPALNENIMKNMMFMYQASGGHDAELFRLNKGDLVKINYEAFSTTNQGD